MRNGYCSSSDISLTKQEWQILSGQFILPTFFSSLYFFFRLLHRIKVFFVLIKLIFKV